MRHSKPCSALQGAGSPTGGSLPAPIPQDLLCVPRETLSPVAIGAWGRAGGTEAKQLPTDNSTHIPWARRDPRPHTSHQPQPGPTTLPHKWTNPHRDPEDVAKKGWGASPLEAAASPPSKREPRSQAGSLPAAHSASSFYFN